MTDFLKGRFSVAAPITETYADNYERTFGHRGPKREEYARPPDEVHISHFSEPLSEEIAAERAASKSIAISVGELRKWKSDLEQSNFQEQCVRRTAEAIGLLLQIAEHPNK